MPEPAEMVALIKRLRKAPLFSEGGVAVDYGVAEVELLIPHRSPMRLVDGLDRIDLGGRRIRGRRTLDPADPIFAGHFPGSPVYPGVLQVESMGQAALCLTQFLKKNTLEVRRDMDPIDVRALRILYAQYLEPLLPGDTLELHASILDEDGMTATCAGQIVKQGRVASFSLQEVYFVE